MRKIFLDCGGNLGRAVRGFTKAYPDSAEYEIFSFEPQTRLVKFYDGIIHPYLHVVNKAVWTHDGFVEFHYTKNVKGSTCFADYAADEGIVKSTKVPCIGLSAWITNSFDVDDYIVVKMNIEGAEYPILEQIVDDGTSTYINELYVSPHVSKVDSISKQRATTLLTKLKAHGIEPTWPPPWGHVRPQKYPFDQIGPPQR